ncbi:Type-1 restriction enzyme R protein, partial [Metamycoplasma alkalescens]
MNQNKKFSAIFATSSISDAIKYFDVFQELISEYNQKNQTDFKVTALFDPNIDFSKDKYEDLEKKYDSIKRIIDQYNLDFKTSFDFEQHADFKIDLSNRLAHKNSYLNLSNDRKLDLLIVVEQMLTGFDSKW